MKQKAIVFTRFPYESAWGGEESHTLLLAQYFQKNGYEIIFMGSCPILLKKFQEQGIKTEKMFGGKMMVTPWTLIIYSFLFPFILWNLRRHFLKICSRYDVKALCCLSLNEKLWLSSLAAKMNIPVTWIEHQEMRNWLLKNPWKVLYKKNARHVIIVPIGKKNYDMLHHFLGISKENLKPILHGVDLKKIFEKETERQRGLIIYANRLIPKKGIMDFIEAVSPLVKEDSKLQIMIIGEGELEKEVSKYFSVYKFLKNEKWYELLSTADLYISCARDANETFSLNTAEAMANGCKVVVTRCCGIADELHDGYDSFLTAPKNPQQLRKKIEEALCSDELIRKHARETVKKKFDLERMLKEYHTIILRS